MRTALVLGGGGPIGIAWEAGLLLGLHDQGIDLSRVDRIIGTSAGSIVGTHLAMLGSVEELYLAQATPFDVGLKPPNMAPLMAAFTKAKLFHRTVQGQRRSIAKSAIAAKIDGEQQWLDAIASFLPVAASDDDAWPAGDLVLTAIDVETGELVQWTRRSQVPLAAAVASSCAVPCVYPLVHIGNRVFMDGGMGSPTNALLAERFDQVIIADPLARMMGRKSPMLAERAALGKQGTHVISFAFSDAIANLIGMNLMAVVHRQRVAELGREQGASALEARSLRHLTA